MSGQTRLQSWIEVCVNITVGLVISVVMTHFLFNVSLLYNIWISVLFTAVSVARSYVLRRIFNRMMVRRNDEVS